MARIINPSTLSSLIRYLQSVSLTLGIPTDKLPEKLETFANALNNFFNKIWEYLPHFPSFDVRVRIVILAFALPTIFDFVFTWITGNLIDNLQHIFDVIAVFSLFFEIGKVVMSNGQGSIDAYVLIPICIIYGAYRLYVVYKYIRDREPIESLNNIVDQIVNYFMKGIIPGTQTDLTEDDINAMLEKYNESFVYRIVTPTVLNIGFIIFALTFFSLILAFIFDAFYDVNINQFIQIAVSIACVFFIIMLLMVFLMITIPCLRKPFVSFRKFIRRYGIKALILLLDFLYIPIGTAILENFRFFKNGCGDGFYLSYYMDKSHYFEFLLDQNATCQVCTNIASSLCDKACYSNIVLYEKLSPHLEFYYDVMSTVGPIIVYAIGIVIIGFPILCIFIVFRNRSIVFSIPVFGRTTEVKWSTIITKMTTPGVFLFYMYKHNLSAWALFSPLLKLLAIILTEVAERVNMSVTYLILILYLFVFALYFYFKPYNYFFNNLLEIIIAFSNALLTIVPICAIYNKQVPSWFSIPLSVIIVLLPIIALPYALFCRRAEVQPELDPGMAIDDDGNVVESIVPNQQLTLELIDLMAIWQVKALENHEICPASEDSEKDFYVDDSITIGHDDLMGKVNEMYNLINVVCDSTTTDGFLTMLKLAVIVASGCGGWFFGAIDGRRSIYMNLVC